MYLRYFRNRRRHIFFILSLVCLALFWVNFHLSESLNGRGLECKGPCMGPTCIECREVMKEEKVPDINIFEKLKLKRAYRFANSPRKNPDSDSNSDQICQRPNFELKHDSLKYAFRKLDHLNCTGQSLFRVDSGVFSIDNSVLKGRELKKCDFYGIERVSDDFSTYSEPYTKNTRPFNLIIKEDFVRIKCFLKTEKDGKDENIGTQKERKKNIVDEGLSSNVTTETYVEENYPTNIYDMYQQFEEIADFDQFIVQVYPRTDVHERIIKIMKRLKTEMSEEMPPDVLMIGLDSMSHMSYQRKLPKTYKFLRDELGAVIFNGYNIVGDATTAAVLPMLTGKFVKKRLFHSFYFPYRKDTETFCAVLW